MGNDRYSSFQVAEGTSLSSDLGFMAQTVVADNLTASWMFCPNAGRFVPPFTYGATFPLGAGVQIAQAFWRTPPGVTSPTPSGGQAQVVFTSAALPPSNGQPVVIPSQQVLLPLTFVSGGSVVTFDSTRKYATITFSAPTVNTFTVTLPPGANSCVILGDDSATTNNGTSLNYTVKGNQSGTVYLNSGTTGNPLPVTEGTVTTPPLEFVVSSAGDSTLTITIANSSAGSGGDVKFSIAASFGVQAVAVEGVTGATPVPIIGNLNDGALQVQPAGTPSIPSGALSVFTIYAGVAPNTTQIIATGIAAQTWHIYEFGIHVGLEGTLVAGDVDFFVEVGTTVFAGARFTTSGPANGALSTGVMLTGNCMGLSIGGTNSNIVIGNTAGGTNAVQVHGFICAALFT